MDPCRFDTLTRSLDAPRSRRGALTALLAGTLGLLGLADTLARKGKMGKGKKKKGKKKRGVQSTSPPSVLATARLTGAAMTA
jgi:hypothetical protein